MTKSSRLDRRKCWSSCAANDLRARMWSFTQSASFSSSNTNNNNSANLGETTPLSSLIVDKRGKMFTSLERDHSQKLILDHIHARDVSLLEHVADKFTGVSATMVQREKFSILRTNRFSAVIGEDCLHLFEKDSASSRAVAQKVSSLMKTILQEEQQQQQQQQQRSYYYSFPQLAAEACLDEASTQLELKLRRLGLLVDAVTKPLKNSSENNGERADFELSVGQFQRLLPLKQALDEIDTDIREHHQMLDEALRKEFSFDLEQQQRGGGGGTDEVEIANNVLQLLTSHAGRSRAMGGRVLELKNALRATREVWELQLDVDRNRVVRLNLRATILGMSCAAASLPAAAMGMNVPHGLEESAVGLTGAFSVISFAMGAIGVGLWGAFTRQSKSTFIPSLFGGGKHEKHVRELRALRYVLVNLDNLDDVLRDDINTVVVRKSDSQEQPATTNRERVRKEIQSVGDGAADAESVDLVFEVFDKNRDGEISTGEWVGER
ncbi:unnamed protein product [Bathycoccus prasinos]